MSLSSADNYMMYRTCQSIYLRRFVLLRTPEM